MTAPSREVPIDPAHAALLIIDVQNYSTRPEARDMENTSHTRTDLTQRIDRLFLPVIQAPAMRSLTLLKELTCLCPKPPIQ